MRMRGEEERQTKRSQIRSCCYACFCVWHSAFNWSLSCAILGAGDQRALYIWHQYLHRAQTPTRKPIRPSKPPSHVHREKLPSIRFVTARTKSSLGEGRWGTERRGKEREEGGGERLLHLSQVRLGSQGCQSPFPSPRLGAEEAAERKKNGRKSQWQNKTRLTWLRHAIREWKQIQCNRLQTVQEACVDEHTAQFWQSDLLVGCSFTKWNSSRFPKPEARQTWMKTNG